MTISIRQIHPVFIGEVSGVDLSKPLAQPEVAAIEAGMDRYGVLVFRKQNISDDQQMAFAQNFGVGYAVPETHVFLRGTPEPRAVHADDERGWPGAVVALGNV